MGRPLTDWYLYRERRGLKPIAHGLQNLFKVGSYAVHLVNETEPRNLVVIGLTPNRFTLSLNTFNRTENDNGTVENSQTAFHFRREINVPGRVDDVDRVIIPFTGHGR